MMVSPAVLTAACFTQSLSGQSASDMDTSPPFTTTILYPFSELTLYSLSSERERVCIFSPSRRTTAVFPSGRRKYSFRLSSVFSHHFPGRAIIPYPVEIKSLRGHRRTGQPSVPGFKQRRYVLRPKFSI